MNILHYLWSFLLALGILIFFHELGHYLAARWCGVKVLRFSIGFGKSLYLRRFGKDQTEWSLGVFPLGGYVKMLDEREDTVPEAEQHRAFNTQTLWKRSIIVAAGPIANFLLAILIYWGGFMAGKTELVPVIGAVTSGSIAERAGLQAGEQVIRVGDVSIRSWSDVRWAVIDAGLARKQIEIETQQGDGATRLYRADLATLEVDDRAPDPMQQLGLRGPQPDVPPIVGKLVAGGVAERAGIRVGDRVLSVNGVAVNTFQQLSESIGTHSGTMLQLSLVRDKETLNISLMPEAVGEGTARRGRIGIGAAPLDEATFAKYTVKVNYGPFDGLARAAEETWKMSAFSLKVLWRMLIGDVSLRNVSGPLSIADFAGQSAAVGFGAYMNFLALISISLGVLNLLPVPILDGGHLLYHAVEAVRGKPLSDRVLEMAQRLGFGLLMGLMAVAFFNDFNRLLFR